MSKFHDEQEFEEAKNLLLESEAIKEDRRLSKRRDRIQLGLIGFFVLVIGFGFGQTYTDAKSQESIQAFSTGGAYAVGQTAAGGGGAGGCCGSGSAASPTASAGGCGGGSGGCGATGIDKSQIDFNQLTAEFSGWYAQNAGVAETEFEAVVSDRGCHIQCDVVVDGQVSESFSYRDGGFISI